MLMGSTVCSHWPTLFKCHSYIAISSFSNVSLSQNFRRLFPNILHIGLPLFSFGGGIHRSHLLQHKLSHDLGWDSFHPSIYFFDHHLLGSVWYSCYPSDNIMGKENIVVFMLQIIMCFCMIIILSHHILIIKYTYSRGSFISLLSIQV